MFLPSDRDREYFHSRCCCCVKDVNQDEVFYDDGHFFIQPVRIGKNIICYGRRKSVWPFQCHLGADWMGVLLVYVGIILSNVIILAIVSPLGWPVTIIGGVSGLALLYTYSVVALSDPGIIYKEHSPLTDLNNIEAKGAVDSVTLLNNDCCSKYTKSSEESHTTSTNTQENLQIQCGSCDMNRPITASHCSYCGVCIEALDHHCPWCGKCIGKKTKRMFYLFLGLIQFQCYFLSCTFIYFIVAVFIDRSWPRGPTYP